MNIKEDFVKNILMKHFPNSYQAIYDNSPLIQYIDKKSGAIHGNSKTRRSLANIYAIYSITHFFALDFQTKAEYLKFQGYGFTKLLAFCKSLYGGEKLQNHALN